MSDEPSSRTGFRLESAARAGPGVADGRVTCAMQPPPWRGQSSRRALRADIIQEAESTLSAWSIVWSTTGIEMGGRDLSWLAHGRRAPAGRCVWSAGVVCNEGRVKATACVASLRHCPPRCKADLAHRRALVEKRRRWPGRPVQVRAVSSPLVPERFWLSNLSITFRSRQCPAADLRW